MALRIHKEKASVLKSKKAVPHIQEATVPHIQEAGLNAHQIQEVISNVRQISPTRFDKMMVESMDIINKNRILIDNYYVDLRWRINGIGSPAQSCKDKRSQNGSFENITDTIPIETYGSLLDEKAHLQREIPQVSVAEQGCNDWVSQTDTYKRTLDEKEIRLRKILMEDISKPAPLKRKRSAVIEVSILAQEGPRLIPKKKKRTESSHIIVF